ncbi:unnamed protein product [Brassicogethes aeneus]|uniref:Uncharacterized protein n=1 Tax=Brassicogethes aeneus TaxID=1431903 RepID=A0A9P0B295_BRAAE|nr:unnamed protein product [Brassicogethes aeneus]
MSGRPVLVKDYYPSPPAAVLPMCPVSPGASSTSHLWIGEETRRSMPPHVYKYYLQRTRCYRRQSLRPRAVLAALQRRRRREAARAAIQQPPPQQLVRKTGGGSISPKTVPRGLMTVPARHVVDTLPPPLPPHHPHFFCVECPAYGAPPTRAPPSRHGGASVGSSQTWCDRQPAPGRSSDPVTPVGGPSVLSLRQPPPESPFHQTCPVHSPFRYRLLQNGAQLDYHQHHQVD